MRARSFLNEVLVRNYNKWKDNNFLYYFDQKKKKKKKEIQSRQNHFDHFQYIFHIYTNNS